MSDTLAETREKPAHSLCATVAKVLDREPGAQAMESEGKTFTWGEVRAVADRIDAMIRDSGADPTGAVVFIPRCHPGAYAAFLGLLRAGRTVRMAYPFQSPAGVARDVARLKPVVVIAAAREFSDEVKAAIREQGASAIVIGDLSAAFVPGLERSTAAADPEMPAEPQIQILTSGTTGPPKHFAITYDLISRFYTGSNTGLIGASDGKSEAPPSLLYYPLANISGLFSSLPPLLTGQRTIILDRFSVQGWVDYVRRYRPAVSGTPAAGVQMLMDADVPKEDLASIKFFTTGAAPLDPTVQREFEARYGIPVLLSYGATEFGGPVTAMTPELYAEWGEAKFGSVGRSIIGAKLRVVDPETGEPVPAGQEGLLEVVSPRIGDHWIRTSDVAVIDADDFVWCRGRADGAIMRGGFKLLPETIERALLLHESVAAAAVAPVTDRRLGQVPGAAIQLKPGARKPTFEELEAHLRQHVLATHIPVHWMYLDELPKNVSVKIDRQAVKRLFEAAHPA